MNAATSLLLAFLVATIGNVIKYWLDSKKDYQNEITKERRDLYQKFVSVFIDVLMSNKRGEELDMGRVVTELGEVYKKYILYASPKVILVYSAFFQYIYIHDNAQVEKDGSLLLKLVTNIMKEMRMDLGLSNKHLGSNGEVLLKALLNDYKSIKWK